MFGVHAVGAAEVSGWHNGQSGLERGEARGREGCYYTLSHASHGRPLLIGCCDHPLICYIIIVETLLESLLCKSVRRFCCSDVESATNHNFRKRKKERKRSRYRL